MPSDPRTALRNWLPYIALLAVIFGSIWWLLVIIKPVHQALMLAISLAMLTYPVLFLPVDQVMSKILREWHAETRRYFSALAATIILVASSIGILLTILVALVGNLSNTIRLVMGLAIQDEGRTKEVVELLVARCSALADMFPDLHINLDSVRLTIEELVGQFSVGPAFIEYLVSGTGGFLANCALTIVTLFYLYSQGPKLVNMLMDFLPISSEQRGIIGKRFHHTAIHMLMGTIARALTHGIVLGLLAWGIGGFNPILVALGASFIALLPVAGPTVAWLPLVSVLWSQELMWPAIALGFCAILSSILIDRIALRLAARLGTDELWLSFLLFLAIVGGLIGYGPLGIILGPAAVLAVTIALHVLPALYGETTTMPTSTNEITAAPNSDLKESEK